MSPLDHKLLRDLWRIKGQAIAIGAVIGVGVLMLVMMTGLTASLSETRDAYYERYRLADVFAPVSRAPERIGHRLAEIPGVTAVQTRVQGRALIDLPGEVLPVQAQAVSLPDRGRPALNDVYLTDGRLPASGRPDEIVLLQSFARAHDLRPGDTLRATMNGARRSFDIVGLAQSPEFLYTTAPGELVPDDARFGVIWMGRAGLAAAYDMDGAFNEALLGLALGANESAVPEAVDRLLAPYGGSGAYPLADQTSNRFVSEEIAGLEAAAAGVPPIFLLVSAFLLYIVVSRIVQSERGQIGLIKAFGYTNGEVGTHYFKLILAIAAGGALAGCIGGIAAGRALIGVYTAYFKFPFLVFQLDPASFAIGVAASILSASAGGLLVLRQVFALTPAAAMRPPAPPDFSRTGSIGRALGRFLDQPSRMVVRRLTLRPGPNGRSDDRHRQRNGVVGVDDHDLRGLRPHDRSDLLGRRPQRCDGQLHAPGQRQDPVRARPHARRAEGRAGAQRVGGASQWAQQPSRRADRSARGCGTEPRARCRSCTHHLACVGRGALDRTGGRFSTLRPGTPSPSMCAKVASRCWTCPYQALPSRCSAPPHTWTLRP